MHADFNTQDPTPAEEVTWLETMGFIWKRLRNYPYGLTAVIILSIGVALSEGLSVGLVLPFVESLKGEHSSSALRDTPVGILTPYFVGLSTEVKIRTIAIALFLIQGSRCAMEYLVLRLGLRLQIKVERDLRIGVFDDLMRVGLGFIYKERLANLFTILNSFTGNSASIARAMLSMVPLFTTLVLYLALLLTISWPLTILAVGLAGATTLSMGRLTNLLRIRGRRFNQAAVRLNHLGFESLSAMRLFRLFARENFARQRFAEGVDDLQQRAYAQGTLQALISPVYTAANVLVLAFLLIAATFMLHREDAEWVELAILFVVVLFRLTGPTSGLNGQRALIASLQPALQTLIGFYRRTDKLHLPEGTSEFAGLREGLRLENVSFRYADGEPDVIKDVSFTIPEGKMTAIVGASGSGKSTLVSLLGRLYDPQKGRILVDGVDLKEFKSETWRRQVGVVSQDTFLFNESLRYNVRFGRLDATDEEIEVATRRANAHQFALELPDGYETQMGDRGVRLSGGQAQRVAIARAILADADLLILDEATSSLDTEGERLVQDAIDRVTQQRTVLAIAHRLSTIRSADNIVVLEHGKVVEQGTHQELLARQNRYWHYVQLQDLGTEESIRVSDERRGSVDNDNLITETGLGS